MGNGDCLPQSWILPRCYQVFRLCPSEAENLQFLKHLCFPMLATHSIFLNGCTSPTHRLRGSSVCGFMGLR